MSAMIAVMPATRHWPIPHEIPSAAATQIVAAVVFAATTVVITVVAGARCDTCTGYSQPIFV